jgi:hypothetical protein
MYRIQAIQAPSTLLALIDASGNIEIPHANQIDYNRGSTRAQLHLILDSIKPFYRINNALITDQPPYTSSLGVNSWLGIKPDNVRNQFRLVNLTVNNQIFDQEFTSNPSLVDDISYLRHYICYTDFVNRSDAITFFLSRLSGNNDSPTLITEPDLGIQGGSLENVGTYKCANYPLWYRWKFYAGDGFATSSLEINPV